MSLINCISDYIKIINNCVHKETTIYIQKSNKLAKKN